MTHGHDAAEDGGGREGPRGAAQSHVAAIIGPASARLIGTAVLSGLAGVAGILLVYLSGTAAALVPNTAHPQQTLNQIFDPGTLPVALVVAAVCGATPSLLITSLAKLGDKYATNLTSTHATPTSRALQPR